MKYIIAGLTLLAILGGGSVIYTKTRGLRNKNPGNIRQGDPWRGLVAVDDKGFVIFDTYVNGLRALLRTLKNYERHHGLRTIRQIVYRWAPPTDNNDTESYIKSVSSSTGIGQVDLLSLTTPDDRQTLIAIAKAIVKHENGLDPIPNSVYESAWAAERA